MRLGTEDVAAFREGPQDATQQGINGRLMQHGDRMDQDMLSENLGHAIHVGHRNPPETGNPRNGSQHAHKALRPSLHNMPDQSTRAVEAITQRRPETSRMERKLRVMEQWEEE